MPYQCPASARSGTLAGRSPIIFICRMAPVRLTSGWRWARRRRRLARKEVNFSRPSVAPTASRRVLEKKGFLLTGYNPDGQAVYQREVS